VTCSSMKSPSGTKFQGKVGLFVPNAEAIMDAIHMAIFQKTTKVSVKYFPEQQAFRASVTTKFGKFKSYAAGALGGSKKTVKRFAYSQALVYVISLARCEKLYVVAAVKDFTIPMIPASVNILDAFLCALGTGVVTGQRAIVTPGGHFTLQEQLTRVSHVQYTIACAFGHAIVKGESIMRDVSDSELMKQAASLLLICMFTRFHMSLRGHSVVFEDRYCLGHENVMIMVPAGETVSLVVRVKE
jgi:hypothetical protein